MTRALIALATTALIAAPTPASAALLATATAQWGDLPDLIVYAEAGQAGPVKRADVDIDVSGLATDQPLAVVQCCDLPDALVIAQSTATAPLASSPITLLAVSLGCASLFAAIRFALIRQ